MVTIHEVAKRAGVSISTVSNAINGQANVSEETRRRVLRAAQELNYVPNINARLMKTRKTNNLGLFLPGVQTNYYTNLIRAMFAECSRGGYAQIVHISKDWSSRKLTAAILSSNIDGAVILNEHLEESALPQLRDSGLPLVFFDKELARDKLSSVLPDNKAGIAQGVEYLVHTGHKTIGFLMGSENYDGRERTAVFHRAMEAMGLPVDPAMLLPGFFEEDAAYLAVRGYLGQGRRLPDAFFCGNDEMAYGCLRALREAGLRVPEEISVLGFDDDERAAACDPPLTTVRVALADMGRQAIRELIRLQEPAAAGRMVRIPASMVIRGSCAIRYKGELA